MALLTRLGMLSVLAGMIIVVVSSRTLIVLSVSTLLLLAGALLGLVYALQPTMKPKQQETLGLVAVEFFAFGLVFLVYVPVDIRLALVGILVSTMSMALAIGAFLIAGYRERKAKFPFSS